MPFFKGLNIKRFIIRLVGLPAGEDDAYPLECQGADGAVMRFPSRALTPIELISPRRKSRAMLGKLMKSLADKYGPGKSAMNPKRFAASLNDGSDTRIFLDIRCVRPARAIRTKQRQETRS